jgi:glycosyltransferase involved in cell wall biosynthesis
MQTTSPAISVIMPCHNRAHDLEQVLAAYDRQYGEDGFELIAIDDASDDGTSSVLGAFRPQRYSLQFDHLPTNQGPAAARNRGIALAGAPLILFVGDDVLPDPFLIQGHLAAHRYYRDEKVAVLGRIAWPADLPVNTLMAHIDGVGQQQFSYYYMLDRHEYDFRHFYTANISIHRNFLCSLDRWFDTGFTLYGYEDVELAYRLALRGLRILYAAQPVGFHYHYHTIWSFARRQRNSGQMAHVLTSKHPELRYLFRAQYLRLVSLTRQWRTIAAPRPFRYTDLLEAFTCRLLAHFEWEHHPPLDWLYRSSLDYFYYDGFIRAVVKKPGLAGRLRQAHAARYLVPALRTFFRDTETLGITIPSELSSENF